MAIFNININKKFTIDVGNLLLYYGSSNIFVNSETFIKSFNSTQINNNFETIEIKKDFTNHFFAIPFILSVNQVLDVNNFYNNTLKNYSDFTAIQLEINGNIEDYKVYNLITNIPYLNNTEYLLNLNK